MTHQKGSLSTAKVKSERSFIVVKGEWRIVNSFSNAVVLFFKDMYDIIQSKYCVRHLPRLRELSVSKVRNAERRANRSARVSSLSDHDYLCSVVTA